MVSNIYTDLDSSLGQFRILRLLPGSKNQQIRCDLFVDVLPTDASIVKPQYDALSYEWGDPEAPQHEILLCGQSFTVRYNLFQALQRLRFWKEERNLWIDALCIDQTNVQERNHQVGRMSDIYRSAACVHIWLGEDEGEGDFEGGTVGQSLWRSMYLESVSIERLDVPSGELFSAGYWGAVAAFFERTYWSRIWIVQEYLLADSLTLYWGSHTISGSEFQDLVEDIERSLELARRGVYENRRLSAWDCSCLVRIENSPGLKISRFRSSGISSGERTLIRLLETCRDSKSSDAHDRVYAILGLAIDVPSNTIQIDYNRSIFKLKMDVIWFYHTKLGADKKMVSETCQLLDEIFADCVEED